MKRFLTFFLMFTFNVICIHSKTVSFPKYIALEPDLNQYYLYANGGWDGNWYVGYNNCWIVKLPPISTKNHKKVYIGAKLGRAKTYPMENKPWVKAPFEGKLFMAVSQNAQFSSQETYVLVNNKDIPLETPKKESLLKAGNSQWFWIEVPARKISATQPNYLALWSGTESFVNELTSPIVAGAVTNGGQSSAWLNRSIKGVPPRDISSSLETPLKGIAPAMAIKLVPQNNLKVEIKNFEVKRKKNRLIISFNAHGQDIDRGWVELSHDKFNWAKFSRFVFNPPYSISIDIGDVPDSIFYLRASASDIMENTGHSQEIKIDK